MTAEDPGFPVGVGTQRFEGQFSPIFPENI